jgi:hypothetical protein
VSSIGDELKNRDERSKVFGISLKARSAILPAGHRADGAFWFDDDNGAFISSNYYFEDLPRKVTHFTVYNYDSHVPVMFFGPGIKPGVYREEIEVNDIAPTLATFLDVERPSGAFGRVLTELIDSSRPVLSQGTPTGR